MSEPKDQNEAACGGSALTAELEGKKQAILEIAPELLRELFCLPPGAEIVDLRVDINRRGVLELKIDGAGWLTDEGAMLMRTTGVITREFDVDGKETRRSIEWGFPSNDQAKGPGGFSPGPA